MHAFDDSYMPYSCGMRACKHTSMRIYVCACVQGMCAFVCCGEACAYPCARAMRAWQGLADEQNVGSSGSGYDIRSSILKSWPILILAYLHVDITVEMWTCVQTCMLTCTQACWQTCASLCPRSCPILILARDLACRHACTYTDLPSISP